MPIELICPSTGKPLRPADGGLMCQSNGARYPVVDGIPILLPDEADRKRVLGENWFEGKASESPLDFYNNTQDHGQYCRSELPAFRAELESWIGKVAGQGPILEIGSGKGALQGIAQDYVALDYSYTALKEYIRPEHQRVCGTAERLPFPDRSVALVYSVAALEHVPEADRAFAEIDRVLKPGGIAYLAPAWHCMQDNCEGIPVRPYADLSWRQRVRKLTLPLRSLPAFKAGVAVPLRMARRVRWALSGRRAEALQFTRLRPDYSRFWMSDSDAVARLDSHEGCLFFHSRGYELLRPGPAWWRQVFFRHGPVVARKGGRFPKGRLGDGSGR